MIPVITLSYVFRLLVLLFLFADFSNKYPKNKPGEENGFAVVELFTSEGCSSCPSADQAIIELSNKFSKNVYFLGYHVDYWNYLGWKDEYSSKTFTKRQERYAEQFNLNSIYTPQVVVNGKTEFVGSDKQKLEKTITNELTNNIGPEINLNAKLDQEDKINITFKAKGLKSDDQFNITLIQKMATTRVSKGENRDRELHHINIVRELKIVNANEGSVEFKIPVNLPAKELRVVAFIQNKKNLIISGATEINID